MCLLRSYQRLSTTFVNVGSEVEPSRGADGVVVAVVVDDGGFLYAVRGS